MIRDEVLTVTGPDADAAFTLTVDADPRLIRVHESLMTIADGRFGTRGSPELSTCGATPSLLAAGVYDRRDGMERLLEGPRWTTIRAARHEDAPIPSGRWRLDLRAGVVTHEWTWTDGSVRTTRFSSLAQPGWMAMRVEGLAAAGDHTVFEAPPLHDGVESGADARGQWMAVASDLGGGITAVGIDVPLPRSANVDVSSTSSKVGFDRLVVACADPDVVPSVDEAFEQLVVARATGFDGLLRAHTAAWRRRWAEADIEVEGAGVEIQRAIRFALFHLMASVADTDEAAVGARGVSGEGYAGHVFWDSDVFVLPFLAATHPPAARAMLEYRLRRLDAARHEARHHGTAGVLFPWESASSGREVTPRVAHLGDGSIIPIRAGDYEDHIVADVAWAGVEYLRWTADDDMTGAIAELLAETARYWASRIARDTADDEPRAHIRRVIGPDEYHEVVDDNAYTNVMARWNLRAAVKAEVGDAHERTSWAALADRLYDGYDADTGLYEQFQGYFGLEPLVIGDIASPPVAADLLVGRERIESSQIIKQPDVLMLHHLVPDEVADGSLAANLDFYLPRTAHGSSLSPAICAALLARAGHPDDALGAFDLALRVDLDDVTGTTAGGLHLATTGGVWMAIVFGFMGIRAHRDRLDVSPRLPTTWTRITARLRHHGVACEVTTGHRTIVVRSDGPLTIGFADGAVYELPAGCASFSFDGHRWTRDGIGVADDERFEPTRARRASPTTSESTGPRGT